MRNLWNKVVILRQKVAHLKEYLFYNFVKLVIFNLQFWDTKLEQYKVHNFLSNML